MICPTELDEGAGDKRADLTGRHEQATNRKMQLWNQLPPYPESRLRLLESSW